MRVFCDMKDVSLPWMESDASDKHSLPWTRQPGGRPPMAALVLGTSHQRSAVPEKTSEDVIAAVPTAQGAVTLRDYQSECVGSVMSAWKRGVKSPLIVLPTGCHAKGQKVLLVSGKTISVEDVAVGNCLLGMDGTPRRVLQLCRGRGRMFRIIPTRGDSFVVNDEHVLSLAHCGDESRALEHIVDVSVHDYMGWDGKKKYEHCLIRAPFFASGRSRSGRLIPFCVTPCGTDDFYGFTLDGDHRYLLDDCTVTHNSGKTIIAASIMERRYTASGGRALFLAHRRELLAQTADKVGLVTAHASPSIGTVQASKNELGRAITLASIQTLGSTRSKRLQEVVDAGPYDVLICDEAHHAVSRQWTRVINALREAMPKLNILGMTATPGRADGTALDSVFDEVVFERNVFDMINLGYLVPPRGFRVDLDISLDEVATRDGDFVRAQLSKLLNTPPVNRAVVEAWRGHAHNRKTIVFAVDVEHSLALAREYQHAGYSAEAVYGGMKKRDRSSVFKRFRDDETRILVNCELAVEGFDEPSVEAIQFARPTESQALFIQALGRGLRLFPGKTECLVIDCVGNSSKHRPVQLASLSGFDPAAPPSCQSTGSADGGALPDGEEEEPTVVDAQAGRAEEFLFEAQRRSRYLWRQTSLGWVLQIPKIGYYLVAWVGTSQMRATIRYYDQRPGRRDTPAVEILRQPVSFDMAYGLVEAEMDRIFAARNGRNARKSEFSKHKEELPPAVSFVDLDEGIEEELEEAERLLLRDAAWRDHEATRKQLDLLQKLGVKAGSLPEKAGEASDLITILRIERDAKRRMPATKKQMAYLHLNQLGATKGMTKGAAARLIWQHRKATHPS